MRSYFFIFNPLANRGRSDSQLLVLRQHIKCWKEPVEIVCSEKIDEIERLAAQAAQSYDVIVACGGDGTVGKIASVIAGTPAALGIVPMGSGNDFIKSVGIPSGIHAALKVLKAGKYRWIDLGKCNDMYFLNTLGFGFDGLANQLFRNNSKLKGKIGYVAAAAMACRSVEPFQAEITSHNLRYSGRTLMITVANGRVEGGSFVVAPHADVTDGMLDLLIVKPVPRFLIPFLFPCFTLGGHKYVPRTNSGRVSKFVLNVEKPVYIHIDGEVIYTNDTEFRVEVLPSALKVIGTFKGAAT